MLEPTARDALRAFVAELDWSQFHSPENLAKSITIEAAELLECFQWNANADPERVREELADVLTRPARRRLCVYMSTKTICPPK